MEIMGVKIVSLRDLIAYETSKVQQENQKIVEEYSIQTSKVQEQNNKNTP